MKKLLTTMVFTGLTMTLLAAPAHADQQSFPDAAGDAALPQADIQSVKVRYGKERTTVAVRFANLPKQDFSDSLRVWIDTSNRKKAPNYQVAVEGYHGLFGNTSGWKLKPNGLDPFGDVMCDPGYKYDRDNGRMLFRFKSKCIGSPKKIRVAVTAEHYNFTDDGTTSSVKDHLRGKRKFTGWVKR